MSYHEYEVFLETQLVLNIDNINNNGRIGFIYRTAFKNIYILCKTFFNVITCFQFWKYGRIKFS